MRQETDSLHSSEQIGGQHEKISIQKYVLCTVYIIVFSKLLDTEKSRIEALHSPRQIMGSIVNVCPTAITPFL